VAPFYLDSTSHFFQGSDISQEVSWQLQIRGGKPPYQVNWAWGDGHQDSSVATAAGPIYGTHRYSQPGAYRITVRVIDAGGREAVITLTAIINGAPAAAYTKPIEPSGRLLMVWPTLVVLGFIVLSFWLGERHKLAGTHFKPSPS
jgi:hypothetical protein